jgi:hypothetical protein
LIDLLLSVVALYTLYCEHSIIIRVLNKKITWLQLALTATGELSSSRLSKRLTLNSISLILTDSKRFMKELFMGHTLVESLDSMLRKMFIRSSTNIE